MDYRQDPSASVGRAMKSLAVLAGIALLCVPLGGCILADLTDLGYMATHQGRHIEVAVGGGDGMAGAPNKPGGGGTLTNAGSIIDHAFGKSTGAGTAALTQKKKPDQGALSNVGAGSGTTALGAPAMAPDATGDMGSLRAPPTRKGLTDGTVPGYGPDSPASGGQVVSALGLAAGITNPAGMLAGAASEDQTNRTLLGRGWDAMFGGKPGTPVQTRNPIANNTNSRGDVLQSNDGVLADRAGAAATAALTGDAPQTGTSALFSDVTLADRRKPKSSLAGTQMLMKAVA